MGWSKDMQTDLETQMLLELGRLNLNPLSLLTLDNINIRLTLERMCQWG